MSNTYEPPTAEKDHSCKTGWNPYGNTIGYCMASMCPQDYGCCAACPKDCNVRCGYATEHQAK